ncbi:MAG: DUF4397 domain-containing protein [Sandaracinus sp.]|nr:DUF4397 domain-containing protein [Sandaracinus sp.]
MKLGLRSGSLSLALMLGIAGVGCGDDDGMVEVDSGTPTDAGMRDTGTPDPDTGVPMEDAGTDAGPPPEVAYVRLAHLSPETGDVQACIDLTFSDVRVGGLGPLPAMGIPFRGISPYLELEITEGATYVVRLFIMEEGVTVNCMLTEGMAGYLEAWEEIAVPAADLTADAFYTGAAIGYADPRPSVCGAEFSGACPPALDSRIVLFEDDSTLDAAAAKIRVLHAIPNAPAVDVCYDDNPEDETPPVAIASNLAFGNASTYFSSDAEIDSGVLTVHGHVDGASCVGAAQIGDPLPVDLYLASLRANERFMSVLPFLPESFALNNIYTIFAQGNAPLAISAENEFGMLFLPWQDAPAPTTM